MTDPGRWAEWLARRDPMIAAFALVRIGAVAAVWYLAAITLIGAALRLAGAMRLVAMADRITVAPVRRLLAGTVSLGLVASGIMAVGTPATRLAIAAAAQPASPQAPGATPATVTMHQLAPTEPVAAVPPSPVPVPPPARGSPTAWTVAPGQCFWSIAETVLTTHLGRAASDAEIVPYWKRLIEANRGALAHRENPDLIFPGQIFDVPSP